MESFRLSPKLKRAIPPEVANQIHGDLHNPRLDARFMTKIVPAEIGSDKTVLRNRLGGVPITQRSESKPENPHPVEPYQGLKVVEFRGFLSHTCRDRQRYNHRAGSEV